MDSNRRVSSTSSYHKSRRAATNGSPRLPIDFLRRIERVRYAQKLDDGLPDEGLIALQTVQDIETAYTFSEDINTHERYLSNAYSGELALFDVVGVAVETRLPPINENKWKSLREYPASAIQSIRLWGCGSGVFGDLLNGVDNIHKYACEHHEMEALDIIGEYSSVNPSIEFGHTIKLSRKLLSESSSTEPSANVDDPMNILGTVENSSGMRYTAANKIAAFDRRTIIDNQGSPCLSIQETNIERVQLGHLVTAAVSFKIKTIVRCGEPKRGKLYAELHTVIIEGREACRDETGPKRFARRKERKLREQGNPY